MKQSTQPCPYLNLDSSSHGRDEIVEMKEQKNASGRSSLSSRAGNGLRHDYSKRFLVYRRCVTLMVGRENFEVRSGKTRPAGSFAILALLAVTLSAAEVYPGETSSSPAQQSTLSKSMRTHLPTSLPPPTTLYRSPHPP